jgi:hypothetical protein
MLMEKYMRAAGRIRAEAMKLSAPSRVSVEIGAKKFERKSKNVALRDNDLLWFNSEAEATASFSVASEGDYEITLWLAGTPAGPDAPKVAVSLDGKRVHEAEVKTQWKEDGKSWQSVTFETHIKGGNWRISVAFLNDYYDEKAPEGKRDRNLAMDSVRVNGPFGLASKRKSRFLEYLLPGVKLGLPTMELTGEDFRSGYGNAAVDVGDIVLSSSGWVGHQLDVTNPGKYRISVNLGAAQAGTEKAKYEIRLGDKVVQGGEVTANEQTPQWFSVVTDIAPGRHDLRVAFVNDFYDAEKKADRNLWLHEAKVEGPLAETQGISVEQLPTLITRLAERLFRRPVTEGEQAQWVGLTKLAAQQGEEPLEAIGAVLEGMLVSPAFLFHNTPSPSGERKGESELIDEVTLANRLAYFLWSGPPSDALLEVAKKKELRAKLPEVVKVMIKDGPSRSLAENFAGQWLQLRNMDGVYRNKRQFPEFEDGMAGSMLRETQLFFNHILQENRSIMDFLTADYTFANKKLAQFYGLKDAGKLRGKEFEKVSLTGTPRGGVLTHGSILTLTSNPTRTNIVARGKFMLESIIGIPPPPVPGNVPPLNEEKVRFSHLTLRQQFEKHREDKSCAGCHAYLDPMGFALENFNAIGQWRTTDNKQPIDATGKWVRGQQFKDFSDLRKIIAEDLKGNFYHCLAEHLLIYAIGRGPEFADRPALEGIVHKTQAAEGRFQAMLQAVCESAPFQRVRVAR